MKPKVLKTIFCEWCGNSKEVSIKNNHTRFCSRKCVYQWLKIYFKGRPGFYTRERLGYQFDEIERERIKKLKGVVSLHHFFKGFHPNSEFKKGNKSWNTGLTKEIDERVANSAIKESKSKIGTKNMNPYGREKAGIRRDLNQFFRSTYEANFARILNYLKIEWDYEICRFKFIDCSWLIDFYLPQFDMWVEVKGWMKDKDKKVFKRMDENYPNENVKVLDGDVYSKLTKLFKSLIPQWEN